MRGLAIVIVCVLAACKGDAPPAQPAPRQMPVAVTDAAADASIGPVLDLASCSPAPLAPAEMPLGTAGLGGIGTGRGRPGYGGGAQGFGVADIGFGGGRRSGGPVYPRVTFGATKEAGVKGAGALLRKRENRLRYCYEQNLARVPSIAGTSTLQIILKETGHPHEVVVENGLDPELTLCLKHILMELQFPAPAKAPVTITQPLTFAWAPPPQPANQPAHEPAAWLPYSSASAIVPNEIAIPAALALQKAMPTAKLATCLGPEDTGSLRVIARIGMDGSVIAARAGGFGDKQAEACISAALVGLKTPAVAAVTDVACDFVRGDPAPWRVDPAGYQVLDTVPRGTPEEPFLAGAQPDPKQTYLVVLAASSPPERIRQAMHVARGGAAYVVAMETAAGEPPLFLVGSRVNVSLADPSSPMLLDAREPLKVCNGLLDAPASAPFADAETLLASAARRCTRKPCPTMLTIVGAIEQGADRTATLIAAARRAGFERIKLGDGACPK